MSFDGIVTRAVCRELNRTLPGGRVTRIYQPGEFELLLQIRSQGKNHKLLLCAHPAYPRLQLTTSSPDNPKEPPMFCRVLRKHLDGAIIDSIEQVGLERIVHIKFRTRNDLGDEVPRRLIVEIMGRHSNIIFIDPVTNTVYDGIRRVSHGMSQYRQIYPGVQYISPPAQNKANPLKTDKERFIAGFDYNRGRLDKQIVERFTGISPLLAKEIVHQAGLGDRNQLWDSFRQLMEKATKHEYHPAIMQTDRKMVFSVWPLAHVSGKVTFFASISECLEHFYYGKAERNRIQQQTHDLMRKLKNEMEKNKKKIRILEKELKQAEKADRYRIFGELITANLHGIKRGDHKAELVNFYESDAPHITIELDPALSPAQNAQRYFKKYNKLKASRKWNREQIEKAREENRYLESVMVQMENASLGDIEQIREELIEEGWLKNPDRKRKPRKKEEPVPYKATATDGTTILIGKNNKQNDYLTHKLASASNIWLHTKEIPGSHVVIRSQTVSEQTLMEAAMLAAYFSKARKSSQVPVDYTQVRHVKKPSGARPGFVTYDHQQTIYVTPREEVIMRLLNPSS
ncbi:Rqc2 family fibronectin-binding protein [Thermoactinomyces mirandus]|uniref:Rqc2 homolog RqcH n=1 Tax=Thermoactinomyces mirandus TaxID=2756294 RepID=A0A7W1XPY9_9BACL|nr:NFACT RNA binding domain-containing protein [Thermoactinomyces mirandus]MBA4601128.1 NFACT family protein [Thermoactinomyces mirandus]